MEHLQASEHKPSHRDYPELECPICWKPQKPVRLSKNGAVTYVCKTDYEWQENLPITEIHGSTYTWRILENGELEE